MVFDRRVSVTVQLEVEHGDLSMGFKQLGDDVVSEEATASYDQDGCIGKLGAHGQCVYGRLREVTRVLSAFWYNVKMGGEAMCGVCFFHSCIQNRRCACG